ncbi:VanZ family protein [Acetobacterium wieringae]|uniref:VanZ like family protein n=1 Tax=Acetobacterium wieringae TaxID=52694 RepID=A0A1F2PCS5_9FIRM|nr:VanZ family protein [Acetobacterium wieringae]OFV69043.1 VanZ like family protein [Acetobacterium wieringae]
MKTLEIYVNFFIENGPFSSRKTVVITLMVILILISLLIINRKKWTIQEKCFKMGVWFYLYLIFLYTFIARSKKIETNLNLTPFWSYQHILETHELRIVLVVLINVLMFVPVGLLVPWAYENILHEDEQKKRNTVLLFGLLISLSLEFLQLFTQTGLFEWDDIFHNMIGMIVGYGIYLFLKGKPFWEVHRYFLPMIGVGLALMIAMI